MSTSEPCRWCGDPHDNPCRRTHRGGRCVWEEIAHAFYDHYFRLLERPDITWETFALGDHVLFATAMRRALDPRLPTDDFLWDGSVWDYVHSQ